ncbi:MAG TPA: hypothetical protein VGE83_09795 [Terracidiphilus sp.]
MYFYSGKYSRNTLFFDYPLLGSLFLFIIGGFGIHFAMRDAALARAEKTTEASVTQYRSTAGTRSRRQYNLANSSVEYRCSYNFSVDGESYSRTGYISEHSVDDSIKAELQKHTDVPLKFSATVYYDSLNPSISSLTEFGVESENQYRIAGLVIGSGLVLIVLVALGAVLTASNKNGNGGIIVDAKGTVIYPEEVDAGRQGSADNPTKIGFL